MTMWTTVPRSIFICMFAAAMLLLGLAHTSEAHAVDRPNVILIMTDDQGYGDFGAKGNQAITTPHLDRLAAGGASTTDFYVHPVCSTTRASLMTGRDAYRTRVVDTWRGRSMMEPEEVTVAEALNSAGYRTGIFGKWHLGDSYPMRPIDRGFDESLIHLGGGLGQPSEPMGNKHRYTNPILYHNGRKVQTWGYCTDVYTDYAIRFMRDAHENGEPFFVYHATNAPHGPYHDVPEDLYQDYLEKSDQLAELIVSNFRGERLEREIDTIARIFAMITNVDQNVGRMMDELEELGVLENTLVIFLNDNGPNTRRYVGPFRGMKGEVYEGGIRSPLWLHWPARLSHETRITRPTAHIDLMPTILDACNVPFPEGVKFDGRSLLPLLTDQPDADWPPRTLAIQTHRGGQPQRYHHFMIRKDRWKLVNNSGFGREQLPKEPEFELYDLEHDPGETRNLVQTHPEIVQRLKNAYDAWFDDVSTTRPDNFAPPRIILGSTENPTKLTRQDLRDGPWLGYHPDHDPGYWPVTVASDGRYDVLVIIEETVDAPQLATVHIGDEPVTRTVAPHLDMCLIPDVPMSAGDHDFIITLTAGEASVPPHQVIVTRRSP